MTKFEKTRLALFALAMCICIGLLVITSKTNDKITENTVHSVQAAMVRVMETGYAQGQADALKDTIRIRMVNDSTAVWVSSPWGKVKPIKDTIFINVLHK